MAAGLRDAEYRPYSLSNRESEQSLLKIIATTTDVIERKDTEVYICSLDLYMA